MDSVLYLWINLNKLSMSYKWHEIKYKSIVYRTNTQFLDLEKDPFHLSFLVIRNTCQSQVSQNDCHQRKGIQILVVQMSLMITIWSLIPLLWLLCHRCQFKLSMKMLTENFFKWFTTIRLQFHSHVPGVDKMYLQVNSDHILWCSFLGGLQESSEMRNRGTQQELFSNLTWNYVSLSQEI